MGLFLVTSIHLAMVISEDATEPKLYEELARYVAQRESEFDQIPADRKAQLQKLADYIRKHHASSKPTRLLFICTHNSRRSHMSQLWAAVAAARYGFEQVESYSGGTEITAFNPRAVAAMQRAGLEIEKLDETNNPKYKVAFMTGGPPQICFSKVYSDAPNPSSDFCAVLTCSSADKECPMVSGASFRISLPYDDPKVSDNTKEEKSKYDERAAQISRELLYAFSQAQS